MATLRSTFSPTSHIFQVFVSVWSPWLLLSCTSKWSREVEVHCVQCHSLFQSFFSNCIYSFKRNFSLLVCILPFFLRIPSIDIFLTSLSVFLCILLITWKCVQLHGFGCFCPTITNSVDMKGMKQIALTSSVMDFRNNPALLIPNYNNTVSSCLLTAPHLYVL